VLEALGVSLTLTPEQIADCIESIGVGFMFAPAHHGAMKYAVGPRKELGMRTLFNVLGPLTNPASVRRQVLGVYDAALCEPLARALQKLGSIHALVLHSEDGLDEISIATSTHGVELKSGELAPIRIDPSDYGHSFDSLDGLQVETADASAALIQSAFAGDQEGASCKARAIIALNAGAGIYVSGGADNLADGIVRADGALGSGAAAEKLAEFVSFTQTLSAQPEGGSSI
jgi:anthranilate phosphoribosyltransferase